MSFDNINLEKGLYTTGKSFTQALEELDPSENYRGTSLEGLDAYERQLKRFDIKVSGPESDTISKFFSTTNTAALFPEYISRAVNQGAQSSDKIEKIIATTTNIDSMDYRSIYCNYANGLGLNEVSEGTNINEMVVNVSSKLTKLKKYARMITASYEAIKFQKLDLFTITLKKIGESISNSEFKLALQTIFNNDNINAHLYEGDMEFDNIARMWCSMEPFNMTTLIMNNMDVAKLIAMPEFRDSYAGLKSHGTGEIITPFGAEVVSSADFEEGTIIALDKNYAIEKVQAGGIVTEYDKLIDRQLERATISTIVGFNIICEDAMSAIAKQQN